MNEATIEGNTEAVTLPEKVCLVASRFFFVYDEKYGEFRKKIHSKNLRYVELREIVNEPQSAPAGERNPHGRILNAWDVYDTYFQPKGHTLVTVCGGYNGGGSDYKWCEYLDEIKGSVNRLVDKFGGAWLVDLHEHSDVWYATIGFEDHRGLLSDGSDHVLCFSDDALAYDRYRATAIATQRPFGIVDWGHRSFDWAWAKISGPYAFPRKAFHGSLINHENLVNHYAVFDADRGCFGGAFGVYESENGQAFYVVTETEPGGLDTLMKTGRQDLGKAATRFLLENRKPQEQQQLMDSAD